MATNIYRSEITIHFFSDTPTVYFGWFISTSGDSRSIHPFESAADRDAHIAEVDRLFPEVSQGDGERLAAAISMVDGGDDESDFAEFAFAGEFSNLRRMAAIVRGEDSDAMDDGDDAGSEDFD